MINRNFTIRKSDIMNRRMFIIGIAKLIVFEGLIIRLFEITFLKTIYSFEKRFFDATVKIRKKSSPSFIFREIWGPLAPPAAYLAQGKCPVTLKRPQP